MSMVSPATWKKCRMLCAKATRDYGCAEGLKRSEDLHKVVYASPDAIEGPTSCAEKRPPAWLSVETIGSGRL